ncbi:zinc transport system substrate-binding protein [Kineosphaera limosa]|uniref:Putative metal ABC transporter substrate-binding protein n=1 Tax=Kineosphaera limosa NBRC 100340 TaxID=1184609 RepID=K6VFL7_9MICO|nr:zinc ABC transporter substrate-binding protein [Kineosphaera limosa]NYE00546.1 zinc transport system substrate-binding protein [Kineosphaera limosa]GAB94988.1 putative metal ABC transporter substrate-binding protein [Kineosphaera limosa NBRC 100340]
MPSRRTLAVTLAVIPLLALAGCGSGDGTADSGQAGETATPTASRFTIVTGAYPVEWLAQRIGGDHVNVVNLTKPGAEPHDLELSPQDVATVADADLVIYEQGLQPALDDAVTSEQGGPQGAKVLEIGKSADLTAPQGTSIGAGHSADDGHDHSADDGHGADDGHDHGDLDPHFWLDPIRYESVARAIYNQLGNLDQVNKQTFATNLSELSRELTTLDGDFSAGLRQCQNTSIVTAHAAFGYLAGRYGLTQVAITGLAPEGEPDPARIAEVTDYVRAHNVTTIYTEPLINPAVAKTVAQETGAATAVLDPIESLTDSSAGQDYLQIMRANLETLQKGQGCS